jgi:hypothetical protein
VICPTFGASAVARDAGASLTPAGLLRLQGVTVTARQLLAALICAAAFAVIVAPAAVAAPLGVLGVSGSTGTGDGQFRGTGGAAVNDSTGDVYVIDLGGQRIERFSAAGAFQDSFGVPGAGSGQFAFETVGFNAVPSLAIDQSDGSVYVADPGNNRVQKFSAAGAYVSQFGTSGAGNGQLSKPIAVAVDPNDGAVYVVDNRNYRVQKFSSAGAYVSQFGEAGEGDGQFGTDRGPTRIGVDSAGRVYVLDQDGSRRVQRFTAAGAFDQVLTSGDTLGDVPFDLAVDSGGDHVFVGGYINGTITEFDGTGATVDAHLNGASIQALSGIGLRAGVLTFAAGSDGFDGSSQARLFRVGAVTAATLSVQPTTDISSTAATLNGSINPNGAPNVTYRFEVSGDFGTTWTPVPVPDAGVGVGTTDVPVSQVITGLKPNTFYFFQLVVTKEYNGTTVSGPYPEYFQTPKTVPTVSDASADPTVYGAKLIANVNPNGVESSYQFEYGLTSAYGNAFPIVAVSAGASYDPVRVTKTIGGLDPSTTYHFRIVATNEVGTSYGTDQTFTTETSARPTEPASNGRAFEQVSPREKRGLPVNDYLTVQSSITGNALAYAADGALVDGAPSTPGTYYVARRGTDGWTTKTAAAPQGALEGTLANSVAWLSDDLATSWTFSSRALTPGATENGTNVYRKDVSSGKLSLGATEPTPGTQTLLTRFSDRLPFAASADASHFAFASPSPLVPGVATGGAVNFYEITDGGNLSLINRLPDGAPTGTGGLFYTAGAQGWRFMSADGKRVYFSEPDNPNNPFSSSKALYLRTGGTVTTLLSRSHRPADDPAHAEPGQFYAASRNGDVAYFSSNALLTVGASSGALYRYDASDDSLTSVVELQDAYNHLTVQGISEDGSRAFFSSSEALTIDATAGQNNFYVADAGGVRLIATGDEGEFGISDNGRYKAFESDESLTGEPGVSLNVFVYDADQDELRCASCQTAIDSDRPARLVQLPGATISGYFARQVLNDGRTFFTTAERFTSSDTNGKADVYQWQQGVGRTLISSGQGSQDATFADASPDGTDVFFVTRGGLVEQDVDGLADYYTARVDGGLPGQNKLPNSIAPPCVGDECQGAASPPVGRSAPGTSRTSSGQLPVAARKRFTVKRLRSAQLSALEQGNAILLTVTANFAGRLSVRGQSRYAGQAHTVLSGSARLSKAGSTGVRLRLISQARRELKRRRVLNVLLTVSAAGVSDTRSSKLVLRLPKAHKIASTKGQER